jgi:hypothetical protein
MNDATSSSLSKRLKAGLNEGIQFARGELTLRTTEMRIEPLHGQDILAIHGFLSPTECDQLIARSEAIGYEVAAVGGEVVSSFRNNARAFLTDKDLAGALWQKSAPFIPGQRDGWEAVGLHENFRFYRYETGEEFKRHCDGTVRRGDHEQSKMTFMVYLSDVTEGGATVFYLRDGSQIAVQPQRGKALVFDHLCLHAGTAVIQGRKYVLRTDVMYQERPAG